MLLDWWDAATLVCFDASKSRKAEGVTYKWLFSLDEPVSSENLNGHATSSVISEEVKVDIESPETPLEIRDDKKGNISDLTDLIVVVKAFHQG